MAFKRTLLVLSLLVLPIAAARAQTPAGPPRINLATIEGSAILESIAVDGQGNVTLLWQEEPGRRSFVRRFSGTDAPLEPSSSPGSSPCRKRRPTSAATR